MVGPLIHRVSAWLSRNRRWISAGVAGLSLLAVAHVLARQDWAAIVATVSSTDPQHAFVASLLVALSFLALSGYDAIAIRLSGHPLPPFGLILKTSFVGTVVAMNFGFTVLSGSAVRAWYYGRAGIPAKGIAMVLAHMAVTFLLGWLGLFGTALLVAPAEALARETGLPVLAQRALGLAAVGLLIGYIVLSSLRERVAIGRVCWTLPGPRLAVAQVAVGIVDACIAGLVVYYLLPPPLPGYLPFMGTFVTAVLLGMLSQVPGGFGVIEVVLMQLLGGTHEPSSVLASMVLYRLLNFIAPLGLAGVIVLVDLFRWKNPPP